MAIRSNTIIGVFVALAACFFIGGVHAQESIRTVVASEKDEDGLILGVCNRNETWRYRSLNGVIQDINSGEFRYETLCEEELVESNGEIKVMKSKKDNDFIKTKRNETECDNLDELPDCFAP